MTAARDLGLTLPLRGVQLIEASAGTGKTFTVATLYARLVIEAALPVPRLLAVTFTEAATRELRDALRDRLALARRLVEGSGDAAALADAVDDDVPTTLTKALLRAALAREPAAALRRRLRQAVEQMDLAPIHTIHGFCQRALGEHALLAGQPLLAREIVANEASLRREVATAFWRLQSRAADTGTALASIWKSPQALADSLPGLLAPDALLPEAPDDTSAATLAALRAARGALAHAVEADGASAQARFEQAWTAGALNRGSYRSADTFAELLAVLQRWCADPATRDPAHAKLGNFGAAMLRKRTNQRGTTPVSPVFDAIDAWQSARNAHDASLQGHKLAIVHAARRFAIERLARLKRERGLAGFDDLIRDVDDALHDAEGGAAFAAALQRQYAVALVDEFQDTDPRQWRIFERLFAAPAAQDDGAPRALVLIGDPKQAIYRFRGGDVATYLDARRGAPPPASLAVNFRSRPRAVAAVQALFQLGGPRAFAQDAFDFVPVAPAPRNPDALFERDGAPGPGLVLQPLVVDGRSIDDDREQATAHCVAAIHSLLRAGAGGRARMRPKDGGDLRPVRPGDIAVLVPTNRDAARIQRALSAAGIPSVAAGRCSLYATDEARDACWLLEALAAPADDGRLRALLASPLFALDAAALAALDTDLAANRARQDDLLAWLQRARRHGPMAVLAQVCAQQAPRLLALADGERRLGNYLQLAEDLQAADLAAPGIAGVLAELRRRIADADERNDAELLRLESDAARVRIMTMHVSKGLTLDFVFLPYAATCGGRRNRSLPPIARVREGAARVAHLFPDDAAQREHDREEAAEDLRVLYVALTRARLCTWVAWGACKEAHRTALAWLLHRAPGVDPGALDALEPQAMLARLRALQAAAPDAIEVADPRPAPEPADLPRLAFVDAGALPPVREVRRVLDRDWWVYSFSQLAREAPGTDAAGARVATPASGGADDESEPPPLERNRFSGTRFGNALHLALEQVDFAAWRDWDDELPPHGQLEIVQRALAAQGYGSDADQLDGVPVLTRLVAATLNVALPEGTRLALLPPAARCLEMEFHLALAPLATSALLARLHAHGLLRDRHGFGPRQRLEGLLTGKIDLVYEAHGRYYVLDYKSNQLPDYGAEALARAMRDGEYDLQYVLYSLALHRWLRFRLGAAYDPATHLGGVRYVFSRGLVRDGDPRHADAAPGIHAVRVPDALLRDLDALFAGEAAA